MGMHKHSVSANKHYENCNHKCRYTPLENSHCYRKINKFSRHGEIDHVPYKKTRATGSHPDFPLNEVDILTYSIYIHDYQLNNRFNIEIINIGHKVIRVREAHAVDPLF